MISDYADSSYVRFHMPGHGGIGNNCALSDVFKFDVTENSRTDNLYDPLPDGPVYKTLKKISGIYKSRSCVVSAHGATAAIRTAVYVCSVLKGRKFLLDRCVHTSVINSLALCGCDFVYFSSFDELSVLIGKNVGATVIITSPNYYGELKDVKRYVDICDGYSSFLIVDNSHGSHLPWCHGVRHPMAQGAHFCVDSVHKTLPALTGGAILHSNVCSTDMMLSGMRLFNSTSPSYLIAASVDNAVDHMDKYGTSSVDALIRRIDVFEKSIFNCGINREKFKLADPCRITLVSEEINGKYYDMTALASHLEERGIIVEFATVDRCVLIPSFFNTDDDFDKLSKAVLSFTKNACLINNVSCDGVYPICKRAISLTDAVFANKKTVDTSRCVGKVSACTKYVYPPGIPIITPGDIIDDDVKAILLKNNINEIDVIVDEKDQA